MFCWFLNWIHNPPPNCVHYWVWGGWEFEGIVQCFLRMCVYGFCSLILTLPHTNECPNKKAIEFHPFTLIQPIILMWGVVVYSPTQNTCSLSMQYAVWCIGLSAFHMQESLMLRLSWHTYMWKGTHASAITTNTKPILQTWNIPQDFVHVCACAFANMEHSININASWNARHWSWCIPLGLPSTRNGENQPPVTNEPVEVQNSRKTTHHFKGIYVIYFKLTKENQKITTCTWLDLETPCPKNLPGHWPWAYSLWTYSHVKGAAILVL